MNALQLTFGLIILGIILLVASHKGWIDDQRIANIAAVLAFIVALAVFFIPQAFLPDPEPTLQPTPPASKTPTKSIPTLESPTPTISDRPTPTMESSESNWARPFEYRFPPGFWTIGTHEYTLDIICSTLTDDNDNILRGSWNVTFQVSEDAELYTTPLYLRLSGIRTGIIEGEPVEIIHPVQETVGVLTLAEGTREEAELSATDCNATIKWDNAPPQVLVPKEHFQQ